MSISSIFFVHFFLLLSVNRTKISLKKRKRRIRRFRFAKYIFQVLFRLEKFLRMDKMHTVSDCHNSEFSAKLYRQP